MSFNFRRRTSSPRTPEEYVNGYTHSAVWRTSKKNLNFMGHLLDIRKILQVVGICVVVIVVLALFAGFLPEAQTYHDPFRVDRTPTTNFFADWEGDMACRLSSKDIYLPPILDDAKSRKNFPLCSTRAHQLQAMSNGGRFGFDMPYLPHDCHYKWYSALEICMILDRLDGVVFVGDELIGSMYAAFNMLMRKNLKYGAMEQWRMQDSDLEECGCRKQFTNPECAKFFVQSSEDVVKHDLEGGPPSPYVCHRTPHWYFPVNGPAPPDTINKFRDILEQDPHSWKPVAIVHSLGLSTRFDWQAATESIDEWLTVADNSGRNSPMLWVGPNAAGHLKPPSRIMQEGNNALWHYSLLMVNEAKRRGIEALSSYNMTLQASSWDGSNYDERVSLVQAMMVINWLAKVETT